MADDSIGRISLDLEVSGDIEQQLSAITSKIKQDLESVFSGNNSVEQLVKNITVTFRKSMDEMSRDIEKTVRDMIVATKKIKVPVGVTNSTEATHRTRETPSSVSSRAPPELREMQDEYKELEKCIEATEKALAKLLKRQDKAEAIGVKKNSQTWKGLQYDIDEARNTLQAFRDDLENLKLDIANLQATQILEDESAEFEELSENIQQAGEELQNLAEVKQDSAVSEITNLTKVIRDLQNAIKTLISDISDLQLGNLNNSTNRTRGNFRNAERESRRLGNSMRDTKKKADLLAGGIFKLGNMLKMMVVRMALKGVIDNVKAGFQNLAQYSNDVNKSASELMSSMTRLKNSFATAFAPIFTTIAPALKFLIDYLSRALTLVAQFTTALTGASTFTRAKKVQQDYAKSIKNTGKAAKDAQQDLMGFDELNKLSDKSEDSSSADGGVLPKDMFESVPIESKIKKMAQKVKSMFKEMFKPFKDAWNNDDTGTRVTQNLSTGMQNLKNIITDAGRAFYESWGEVAPNIANTFMKALESTSEIFKNLTKNIKLVWDKGGRHLFQSLIKLGAKLFELAGYIYTEFVAPFVMWLLDLISPAIAKVLDCVGWLLDRLVDLINWLLNDGKPVLDLILSVIGGIVIAFGALKILNKVKSWFGIVITAVKALGTSLSFLATNPIVLIIGAIIGLMAYLYKTNEAFRAFVDNAVKGGKDFVKGLLKGITTVMTNIFSWLKSHVFEPIVNGIKKLFGIHSPSTVFADIGVNLIKGLLNGIKSIISSVVDLFKNLWSNIKNVFANIGGWFKQKFSGAWSGIKNTFSSASTFFSGVWSNIKNAFSGVQDWFKGTFSGAWDSVKGVFDSVTNSTKNIIGTKQTGVAEKSSRSKEYFSSKLPMLAQGGYVKRNTPQLAVIGDNRKYGEVVAPENKMEEMASQAARKVLAEFSGGSDSNFSGNLTMEVHIHTEIGDKATKKIIKNINMESIRQGKPVILN